MQLTPPLVPEQVAGMRGVGARRDEEYAVHFVRRLRERHAVLERVHNAFGRREAHGLVQLRFLDPEIDERHPAPVLRGRARHIPRGRRRPFQVSRGGHQGHERLCFHERRHQVAEAGSWQGPGRHCVGW